MAPRRPRLRVRGSGQDHAGSVREVRRRSAGPASGPRGSVRFLPGGLPRLPLRGFPRLELAEEAIQRGGRSSDPGCGFRRRSDPRRRLRGRLVSRRAREPGKLGAPRHRPQPGGRARAALSATAPSRRAARTRHLRTRVLRRDRRDSSRRARVRSARVRSDLRGDPTTGGILIGELPCLDAWDARLFGRHWGGLHLPRHLFFWTQEGFAELGRRGGFAEVEVSPLFQPAHWAISVQNALVDRFPALKQRLRNGRLPFYVPLVLAASPLCWLQNAARKPSIMGFQFRKAHSSSGPDSPRRPGPSPWP